MRLPWHRGCLTLPPRAYPLLCARTYRITRPLRLLQGATMSETVPATELPEYAPMALEDVAKVRTNPGHI